MKLSCFLLEIEPSFHDPILSTVGTVRRKSKRDRNRTQTVMMTAPTTMESAAAGAIAKNGYPAMPVTTQPTRAAGKNPTVTAEDVNKAAPMASAAAALVIVHHQHHKRSGYQAVCLWMLRKQLDLVISTGH